MPSSWSQWTAVPIQRARRWFYIPILNSFWNTDVEKDLTEDTVGIHGWRWRVRQVNQTFLALILHGPNISASIILHRAGREEVITGCQSDSSKPIWATCSFSETTHRFIVKDLILCGLHTQCFSFQSSNSLRINSSCFTKEFSYSSLVINWIMPVMACESQQWIKL